MNEAGRVAVIVQARMTSTRLPGKVLAPLAGRPAIVRMMERVRRVTRAAHCLVATSREEADDELAAVCADENIACVRGSLDDVLGRVVAAIPPDCDTVVRLTGDCPLVDPQLVDRHLEIFQALRPAADYVTNAVVRTFPDGLDVEVLARTSLEAADRAATDPYDREHVTPWIRRHARMVPVTRPVDLSPLRLVLDTPSDYETLAAVYAALHPAWPAFDTAAVYRLLVQQPALVRVAGDIPVPVVLERLRSSLGAEASA